MRQGKEVFRLGSGRQSFSAPEALVSFKQLLQRLDQFEAALRAKGAAPEDLFPFLKMWLKAHICGIDTKYVAHSKVA